MTLPPKETTAPEPPPKKKILLVEDEANMMELLKYRLEENNYNVGTAADGTWSFSI